MKEENVGMGCGCEVRELEVHEGYPCLLEGALSQRIVGVPFLRGWHFCVRSLPVSGCVQVQSERFVLDTIAAMDAHRDVAGVVESGLLFLVHMARAASSQVRMLLLGFLLFGFSPHIHE